MSTRKNRHGVVTEKKRNKKHVPMVKKTKVLSWDDLTKIAQESAKLLGYTFAHYEYFRTNRAKIIEDNLDAKESMTGLAKMLADHAEQLKKLALTHTELDDKGNPIIVDGKAKLKRGKFKTDDEGVIASQIVLEYQNEMEGIEPLFDTVLPEVASKLGVPKELLDQLDTIRETNASVMHNVTGKIQTQYDRYKETVQQFQEEQAKLIKEIEEAENGRNESATTGEPDGAARSDSGDTTGSNYSSSSYDSSTSSDSSSSSSSND
jgi:hypothetical protein|nr:MAG TPA: hypothetical protein [Caudoviricetes sp.]